VPTASRQGTQERISAKGAIREGVTLRDIFDVVDPAWLGSFTKGRMPLHAARTSAREIRRFNTLPQHQRRSRQWLHSARGTAEPKPETQHTHRLLSSRMKWTSVSVGRGNIVSSLQGNKAKSPSTQRRGKARKTLTFCCLSCHKSWSLPTAERTTACAKGGRIRNKTTEGMRRVQTYHTAVFGFRDNEAHSDNHKHTKTSVDSDGAKSARTHANRTSPG
jgi:hypothetical protein